MKEVIFVRERSGQLDAISQLKYGIVDSLEKAFNAFADTDTDNSDNTDENNEDKKNKKKKCKTESMILPVVPDIKYPKNADINNYEGLKESYNVPSKKKLETIEWSSIFPVNKNYSFQKAGSHTNGYDYVDFLTDRQIGQKPFRLISFETRTLSNMATSTLIDVASRDVKWDTILKIHFNGLVLVKDFDYHTDTVGDIKYTLTLEEFNSNIVVPDTKYGELGVNFATNVISKYALKTAGLI